MAYLGDHLTLVTGLAAGAIWIGAVAWYLIRDKFIAEWVQAWRARRDRGF